MTLLRTNGQVLALLILSAVLSLLFAVNVRSADVWWHLATGRWIVENGAIPPQDPFSFTVRGEPWVNVNWLGALILYAAYSLGGIAGLVGLKCIVAFGIIYLLGLTLQTLSIRFPVTVVALTSFAILVQPRFSLSRPASIGAMLCAAAIYLVVRSTERKSRIVLLLVPLCLLWINVHSSAVLCVFISLVSFTHAMVFRFTGERRCLPLLVLMMNLGLLIGLPQGREMLTQVISYAPSSSIVRNTYEWQTLRIQEPHVWVPWSLFLFSLVYGFISFRKNGLLLGLALIGCAIGIRYRRHLYLGVLMMTPLFAVALSALSDDLKRRGYELVKRVLPALVLLAVAVIHMVADPEQAMITSVGFQIEPSRYPEKTVRYLRTLPVGRVINDYHLGGYLIWHQLPGGVYIDGRTAQVFTARHIRKLYEPIVEEKNGLDRLADHYDISYGLGEMDYPVLDAMMNADAWIPLFFGDRTVLFGRAGRIESTTVRSIPSFPLLRIFHKTETMKERYRTMLASEESRQRFVEQFIAARDANPESQVLQRIFRFLLTAYPVLARQIENRQAISQGTERASAK